MDLDRTSQIRNSIKNLSSLTPAERNFSIGQLEQELFVGDGEVDDGAVVAWSDADGIVGGQALGKDADELEFVHGAIGFRLKKLRIAS